MFSPLSKKNCKIWRIFSLLVSIFEAHSNNTESNNLRSFLVRNLIFLTPSSVTRSHLYNARCRLLKPSIRKIMDFFLLHLIYIYIYIVKDIYIYIYLCVLTILTTFNSFDDCRQIILQWWYDYFYEYTLMTVVKLNKWLWWHMYDVVKLYYTNKDYLDDMYILTTHAYFRCVRNLRVLFHFLFNIW